MQSVIAKPKITGLSINPEYNNIQVMFGDDPTLTIG
jgi:hypothetical protein